MAACHINLVIIAVHQVVVRMLSQMRGQMG